MADESGRFNQGRWITGESPVSEVKQPEIVIHEPETLIETRIEEVSKNLRRNIDDIFLLTRDLLTTEGGHHHIKQLIDNAGSVLERTVSDLLGQSPGLENDTHEYPDNSPEKTGKNDK